MKILVTGANGFVGSYLSEVLSKLGNEVIPFDIEDGDLKDCNSLNRYTSIDYIYHLAGKTFVPDSWNRTFEFLENNILSTISVLEYCRNHKCGLTLMSTYLYGPPQYLPIDENHPIVPVSPYHESKLVIESLARFYAHSFGMNISVFRPFNIFGKGQNEQFLIPKIVSQVLNPDIEEIVINDLAPKRDYIYIKDVVSILSKTCEFKHAGVDFYNIGSGASLSVRDVIESIERVTGIKKPYRETGEKRKGEIPDCVASIDKIKNEYNYVLQYSFEDGLRDWLGH